MWASQDQTSISIDARRVIGEVPPSPVPVTVDQQEKQPVKFPPEYATVTIAHLKTFDYAVTGDDRWALERKSISDLIQSFTQNGARELRKIERARAKFDPAWPIIYMIEGRKTELVTHDWSKHGRATPQWFISHLFDISQQHNVQFDFCETRRELALWMFRWLKTRFKSLQAK